MIERRKHVRQRVLISMEAAKDSARWQELTKKKWAAEDAKADKPKRRKA